MEKSTLYDSLFKEAEAKRNETFQDWLNTRKESLSQQRTEDVRMARINALGNLLYTMVQPIGWAVGGSTAEMQPYDNRQYLESFNRAVKASDDLRNLGNIEAEYKFKLADENYQRALQLSEYERRQKSELEKQKQIFDMRSQLNQEQIEGRIKVAEANARAKYQFKTNTGRVTESVRDNLIKRANTAYANILSDYYKKKQIGIENLQEPPSYDEFLKKFASENGYQVAESQNSKKSEGGGASTQAGKVGGFQASGSSSTKGKTGGFVR